MKKEDKKGFTLAELLVVLAVMSVIAAILIPAIMKVRPNRNKALFKKAYYMTERIVSELINDEDLYPNDEDSPGFIDTSSVTIAGETYSGITKFCKLFASKMNTVGSLNCTLGGSTFTYGGSIPAAESADGIYWLLPNVNFTTASPTKTIYVDVNGANKPNCLANSTGCDNPDRFTMQIRYDGKIIISGAVEKEYLKATSIIDSSSSN